MPDARDVFTETMTWVDSADGALKPLNNAQVTVKLAGTNTLATLYAARDINNDTQLGNPFTTPANGLVEFWAEQGQYDITVTDLNAPSRVSPRIFGWGAMPAGPGGISAASLAADGALPWGAHDAMGLRQFVPLGTVIDWWRPNDSVPVPNGWEICDGHSVAEVNHDFEVPSAINVPDLRNAFVLGANIANADASSGTPADAVGSAPGIRGTGGNNVRNIQHAHDMGNHTHAIAHTHTSYTPAHYHGTGSLYIGASGSHGHTVNDPGHNHGGATGSTSVPHTHEDPGSSQSGYVYQAEGGSGGREVGYGSSNQITLTTALNTGPASSTSHAHAITPGTTGISLNSNTHTHANADFGGSVGATSGVNGDAQIASTTSASSAASSGAPSTNSTGAAASASQDWRPKYVGLLKLIKVRRA